MWMNFTKAQLDRIRGLLECGEGFEENELLLHQIDTDIADRQHPDNKHWVEAAMEKSRDGKVEVDQQGDDTALVSVSEDGGAYVMAWLYVERPAALGLPYVEPEDEEVAA